MGRKSVFWGGSKGRLRSPKNPHPHPEHTACSFPALDLPARRLPGFCPRCVLPRCVLGCVPALPSGDPQLVLPQTDAINQHPNTGECDEPPPPKLEGKAIPLADEETALELDLQEPPLCVAIHDCHQSMVTEDDLVCRLFKRITKTKCGQGKMRSHGMRPT